MTSRFDPPSNPKHAFGLRKLPFRNLPMTALIHWAAAAAHGADKYGSYNWRSSGVDTEIYYDAILRHLIAWRDGESLDPESGAPHLAHVMACAAILMDAETYGVASRPWYLDDASLSRDTLDHYNSKRSKPNGP